LESAEQTLRALNTAKIRVCTGQIRCLLNRYFYLVWHRTKIGKFPIVNPQNAYKMEEIGIAGSTNHIPVA